MDYQTLSLRVMNFAYRSAGDAQAPLVLCLHGFPDTAASFDALLPQLAAAGFHAVAPCMRGYAPTGLAPDGDYTARALAGDTVNGARSFFIAFIRHPFYQQSKPYINERPGPIYLISSAALAPSTARHGEAHGAVAISMSAVQPDKIAASACGLLAATRGDWLQVRCST